jgi:anthranilate synthase component I
MAESRRLNYGIDPLALHRLNPARYPYLLESVVHGTPSARYDILFAFPGETLTLTDPREADFLGSLDCWWSEQRTPIASVADFPFHGGWFIYLGYELAEQIEPTLCLSVTNNSLPIAFATRIPAAVIRDHVAQETFVISERPELLEAITADIQTLSKPAVSQPALVKAMLHEDPPQDFLNSVQRILSYILEGDVFQVNLSREWRGELHQVVSTADVYQRLREANPAPFAGLAVYGDSAIISSSPERLVCVRGDYVATRPIAGTRPRREDHGADAADIQTLLAHPKERAEHIMLIDLERNDLGRVCVPGSVRVEELMTTESYAHVHHIVSSVSGRLRPGVTPGQVIRAVFPGGTITGCPKVRCMEIIAELEQTARGAYTGAMGYLNHDGSMDLNILIRTLVKQGKQISLRAGAGIVADSIPERELEETRAKARGLLRALGTEI